MKTRCLTSKGAAQRGGLLALMWLVLPACTASAPPTEPQRATALSSALEAAIGPAHCDSDSQCRTVAVGQKACGGPENYLPWSTLRTDATAVARAAEARTAAQVKQQPRGMVGNCMFVVDPGAVCVAPAALGMPGTSTASRAGPGRCALRDGDTALK